MNALGSWFLKKTPSSQQLDSEPAHHHHHQHVPHVHAHVEQRAHGAETFAQHQLMVPVGPYSADGAPILQPLAPGEHRFTATQVSPFYVSTSYLFTSPDGRFMQVQVFMATVKPLHVLRPGILLKLFDGEQCVFFWKHSYESGALHQLEQDGEWELHGISVRATTTAIGQREYVLTVDSRDCPLRGELRFAPETENGCKFGDGKIGYTPYGGHERYCSMLYAHPRVLATARFTYPAHNAHGHAHSHQHQTLDEWTFEGWGSVAHFSQNVRPQNAGLVWHYGKFHSPNWSFVLTSLVSTKALNYSRVSQCVIVHQGKTYAFAYTPEQVIIRSSGIYKESESSYELPRHVDFSLHGQTLEPVPRLIHVSVNIEQARLIDKRDILGEVPFLIRTVVKALLAAPWHFQWLDRARALIRIEGNHAQPEQVIEEEGWLVHDITYLTHDPHGLFGGGTGAGAGAGAGSDGEAQHA